MPSKCTCPENCPVHDLCHCGSRKRKVSANCRNCYTSSPSPLPNPERANARTKCLGCNVRIKNASSYCLKCYRQTQIQAYLNNTQPLSGYLHKCPKNPSYFVKVRQHARRVAKQLKLYDSGCACCPFLIGLQVCHVNSIASYDLSTPINIVNAPNNLVILCPNCHWLQDHGYPTLEDIVAYLKSKGLLFKEIK